MRDCRTCGFFYPGAGCLSEKFYACGCCYHRVTVTDRLKLFAKALRQMFWIVTGL